MRLLFISYHFPPSRAARSLQVGKLSKHLLRRGVELDVVTVRSEHLPAEVVDRDVEGWIRQDGIRVVDVDSPARRGVDWLRAGLRGENFPRWWRNALAAARQLLREAGPDRYDALVSFAMPIDSHLAGWRLKRRTSALSWVAHFSDPWADNPYMVNGGVRGLVHAAIESRLCRAADLVISVSEELTQHLMKRHGGDASRYRTLPHLFDPEQYPDAHPPAAGPLLLRYLGGFSSRRRPDTLINALAQARAQRADLRSLRVELIGSRMEDVAARLNAIQPGLGAATGAVGYLASLAKMRTAHALLLVDADQEFSPYFPSKLADYFGSLRPIIAISPGHSCSSRLIREYGGLCFDHAEARRLAELFARLAREGPAALPQPAAGSAARFEAARIAEQFERLVADCRRLTCRG